MAQFFIADHDDSDGSDSAEEHSKSTNEYGPREMQYESGHHGMGTVTTVITSIPDITDRNTEWMKGIENGKDSAQRMENPQNEEIDELQIKSGRDLLNQENLKWLHPERGNWGKMKADGTFEEQVPVEELTEYERRKRKKRLIQQRLE